MEKGVLTGIGITGNEAEVYITLLKMGEAPASEIAKKTHISRPHVYDSINKLIEKGLVGHVIRGGRKYFKPANPNKLIDYLKEKEEEIKRQEKRVEDTLPELLRMYVPKRQKPSVEIYEGKEGIKTVLSDIIRVNLKTKKPFVGLGESGSKIKDIAPLAVEKYFRQRRKHGIKARFLYTAGQETMGAPGSEYRPIPKEYAAPAMTIVYGDKVSIWLLKQETPVVIVMESPEIAESYRNHFELMWDQEVKVYKGCEGLKDIFQDLLKQREYLAIGSGKDIANIMGDYFYQFQKEKERLKIKSRIIAPDDVREMRYIKETFGKLRFIPKEMGSPTTTFIYGDRIALCIFRKENPMGFVIERRELADAYRKNFEIMWEREVQVYKGLKNVTRGLDEMLEGMKKGDTHYAMGVPVVSPGFLEYLKKFYQRRADMGCYGKIMYNAAAKHIGEEMKAYPMTSVKYMPEGFLTPTVLIVMRDNIGILIHRKEQTLFRIKDKELADSFEAYFNMIWGRETRVYRGAEEVERGYMELLEEGAKEYLSYGFTGHIIKAAKKGFIKRWDRKRFERGILLKEIYNDDAEGRKAAKVPLLGLNEKRFLPAHINGPTSVDVSGGKMFTVFYSGAELVGTLTEDKEMVETYRKHFNTLWRIAKP